MGFPRRDEYDKFMEVFANFVRTQHPSVCFYSYGSYVQGDFVPGRSDIDGGLILDCGFVTPKDVVHDLANGLDATMMKTNPEIKVQFNLVDRGISKNGRFLAYDDTYTNHLKRHGRIFAGPDFVQEMNGMNYKRESLRSVAYNLRQVRNGLLSHFSDVRRDPLKARKNMLSTISIN